jgi:hypothetical protein
MRITILLALIFTVVFSTAAWAGPPQGPAWEPGDYTTGWKTNSCG